MHIIMANALDELTDQIRVFAYTRNHFFRSAPFLSYNTPLFNREWRLNVIVYAFYDIYYDEDEDYDCDNFEKYESLTRKRISDYSRKTRVASHIARSFKRPFTG